MKDVISVISPTLHPQRWFAINCMVLAWSAFLFVRVLAVVDRKEKAGVELHYLLYNIVVTGVWLVESVANFLDYKFFRRQGGSESIPLTDAEVSREGDKFDGKSTEECFLLIETAVATYFTFDSMSVVFDMTKKNIHRESKGMMLDSAINLVAYGYMIYRHHKSKKSKSSHQTGVDPNHRRIEELNAAIAELKQQNKVLLDLLEKERKKRREDSKEKKRRLRTLSEKLQQLKSESIHDSDGETF